MSSSASVGLTDHFLTKDGLICVAKPEQSASRLERGKAFSERRANTSQTSLAVNSSESKPFPSEEGTPSKVFRTFS